jgi:hypothetical protein
MQVGTVDPEPKYIGERLSGARLDQLERGPGPRQHLVTPAREELAVEVRRPGIARRRGRLNAIFTDASRPRPSRPMVVNHQVINRSLHWTAAVLLLLLGAAAESRADSVVYATADNGTTYLLGTMDLTTAEFTQIATTTPLFGTLTGSPGGTAVVGIMGSSFGSFNRANLAFGPDGNLYFNA